LLGDKQRARKEGNKEERNKDLSSAKTWGCRVGNRTSYMTEALPIFLALNLADMPQATGTATVW